MKKGLRKTLALLLMVTLLLSAIQMMAVARGAEVHLAVLSDPHYYPDEMTGNFCEAYADDMAPNGRLLEPSQGLFLAALKDLKARAKKEGLDYLLVAGDLTEAGEYAGHVQVAQLLRQFERETGMTVAVIPGNHDLFNEEAADFSTGKMVKARNLKPDEFLELYAGLGYDLPGLERFGDTLSYAADLGPNFRLIATDDNRRRLGGTEERCGKDELRDWVLEQCKKAKAAGKTVIGLGHYNLGEQMGNQDSFMQSLAFNNPGETAEAFADAGMQFHFSGHLHFNEIAMRVSDSGKPLYDIITASSAFFPGGYRTAKFSVTGDRVEADVRSHAVPLTNPPPFSDPYYATLFGRCFGASDGSGLTGWVKHLVKYVVGRELRKMNSNGGFEGMVKNRVDLAPLNALMRYLDQRILGQPEKIFDALNAVVAELLAMPVSALPCTRFAKAYGFGDPNQPGTFEDLVNSVLLYLFGKSHDAAEDDFVQDALRRMRDGAFIDQLLKFAVPRLVKALGGDILPLLANNPAAVRALEALASGMDCPLFFNLLLALVVGPDKRGAMSASLYKFASGVVASQSPTGGRDGILVYDGAVKVPTDPDTFRLPQELNADRGLFSAEITWYTRRSAVTPAVEITDKNGNPAAEVRILIESTAAEVTAGQLDIGFTQLMGRVQPVLKHTARLSGLQPGKMYCFAAGDSAWAWWSKMQRLQ